MNYVEYFNAYCQENIDDTETILLAAAKDIYDKFGVRYSLKTKDGGVLLDDTKMLGAVFVTYYKEIIKKMESLRANFTEYEVNFANRVRIGYSNDDINSSEMSEYGVDNEKRGNFAPHIIHIDKKHSQTSSEYGASPNERCNEWINANITQDPKVIHEIADATKNSLSKMKVKLIHVSYLTPSFISVYENLINYIRIRRKETDRMVYTIDFLSCFKVTCIETDDGDSISISADQATKTELKSDEKGGHTYGE